MRSGDLFGGNGMSQSAVSAKQLLDDTMSQNAADPSTQPPVVTRQARPGMAFRGGIAPGGAYIMPSDTPNAPTAPGGPAPLNVDTTITDPSKGGVNDKIHPGFFQHGGLGQKIAGVASNLLLDFAATGGDPMAVMTLRQRAADQDAQRQFATWQAQEAARRAEKLQDRDYEDNKPRYFAGNEDYRRYDPTTNQVDTLFDAPRPEQEYASQFGQPGSPEYQTALQDYVLKGWGSTAMDARTQLNNDRFNQRLQLKQTPTYANLHPHTPAPRPARPPNTSNVVAGILQKGASGQPLNAQEQQIFNSYVNGRRGGRSSGAGGAAGTPEGTIIKNPQTGVRMKMQNGQWVTI